MANELESLRFLPEIRNVILDYTMLSFRHEETTEKVVRFKV
jgi:hypothetical protein